MIFTFCYVVGNVINLHVRLFENAFIVSEGCLKTPLCGAIKVYVVKVFIY